MNCTSEAHQQQVIAAINALDGIEVLQWEDRTFKMHEGGKIEVLPLCSVGDRDDLSMAYTPGVARVCKAIEAEPDKAHTYTIKKNTVAIVTERNGGPRPGRHRAAGRPPGDGGQGPAVQGVRRCRRLPHLPRHADGRGHGRDRAPPRPGLRRHQPRRHRRAPVLRDRGGTAGAARHPGLPRRPARHRGRGDGGSRTP